MGGIFEIMTERREFFRYLSLSCLGTLGCASTILADTFFVSNRLGADAKTLPFCADYLFAIFAFSPFFLLNQLLMAFLRNDRRPKLAMAAMVSGSLANIFLDYLFVYPLNLGIFGAALATGLAPVIGIAVASLHLLSPDRGFHLAPLRAAPRACAAALGQIAEGGLFAFVGECSSGVVLAVFNLLMLQNAGNTGVAAYGIVANLALVLSSLFTGICHGIQPLLSRACGRGDTREAARLYRSGLRIALLMGLAIFLSARPAAPVLVRLFNSERDPILQSLAEEGIRLYFLGFLLAGCNQMTAAFLSTGGQTGTAFRLSFFRGCAGIIAAAFLLSHLLGTGGVWLPFAATEGIASILWLPAALRRRKKEDAPLCPAPESVV